MYNKITMIQLNLEKDGVMTEYNIPTGWEDISVKKFCKMFSTDVSDLHPIRASVTHISILSDISEDVLYEFSPEDFNKLATYFSFMNTVVEAEISEFIEIEEEKYYLKSDFKSFTFGEQTSIEVTLEQHQGNVIGCMDKLLCIFLRKKNEDGTLEKFNTSFMNRYELFQNIPVSQVYQLFTFFSNTSEQ